MYMFFSTKSLFPKFQSSPKYVCKTVVFAYYDPLEKSKSKKWKSERKQVKKWKLKNWKSEKSRKSEGKKVKSKKK